MTPCRTLGWAVCVCSVSSSAIGRPPSEREGQQWRSCHVSYRSHFTESVSLLHSRRGDGGLLNALAEDRTLALGLQARVVAMTTQTFESLNVGFAAGFFDLQRDDYTLRPNRLGFPKASAPPPSEMAQTAVRLGRWFAHYPLPQICEYLQIRL